MKREAGYYWIKTIGMNWVIAEWYREKWYIRGSMDYEEIDEIDEHPIKRFAEANAKQVLGDVAQVKEIRRLIGELNSIMWNSYMIEGKEFGRKEGEEIMIRLNQLAKIESHVT